eukprot:scaffold23690_cov32-Tisochrysis_lutea.AAC.4
MNMRSALCLCAIACVGRHPQYASSTRRQAWRRPRDELGLKRPEPRREDDHTVRDALGAAVRSGSLAARGEPLGLGESARAHEARVRRAQHLANRDADGAQVLPGASEPGSGKARPLAAREATAGRVRPADMRLRWRLSRSKHFLACGGTLWDQQRLKEEVDRPRRIEAYGKERCGQSAACHRGVRLGAIS